MLMHQIALCLVLLGLVGFALAKLTASYRAYKPKHAQETPPVSEPVEVDETWWREIFDYWD